MQKMRNSNTCQFGEKFIGVILKWINNMPIDEQSFQIGKEEVKYWKNQMFNITLTLILLVGTPLIVYGSYVFYRDELIGYAIVQILLYIITVAILLHKRFKMNIKKHFIIIFLYSISLFLLFTTSITGSGMVCVVFTLILSGCLLDRRHIYQLLILNYAVFVVISILLFKGVLDGSNLELYKDVWIINAVTAQGCALVLLLLMNAIYNGLEKQAFVIKNSQEILASSELKHKVMIKNISDSILIIDKEGAVNYFSPNLHERFPWMSKDINHHLLVEEFHPEDRQHLSGILETLITQLYGTITVDIRYKNGEEVGYVKIDAMNLLQDDNINGILITCRDITERKLKEEEVMYLSQHDYLTGLYNRAFYEAEMQRLDQERYYPLSIIIGDINGLKMINDSLGHDEGDKLLISMAKILKKCCKEGDIVTRLGGDEFNILLPNTDKEAAMLVIQQIYETCEAYNNNVSGEIYHISISLGVATKIMKEEEINTISKQAEDAMYNRKLLEGRSYHSSVIASMKAALFAKSYETEQHANRLISLSKMVGEAIGLTRQQFDELELLSALHDIGKIGVEDHILNKPAKLSKDEWIKMKKHSEIGYRIAMSSPELMSIAYYILTHHEHWDGGGYPQGLSGERIPLLSRILSVVDSYDAMTEDRPYRRGVSIPKALEEIRNNIGSQFDPNIAKLFIELMSKDTNSEEIAD
jgi:diguanylate cyclase (GGDEF)-like protein/PAS domain S-box-containing protein